VRHQGMLLGEGRGKSKRGAERAAAAQALSEAAEAAADDAPATEEMDAPA